MALPRHRLTGHCFGRLLVLRKVESVKYLARWLCRCSCGNKKVVYQSALLNDFTKSCGCLNREVATANGIRHGTFVRVGGVRPNMTSTYRAWNGMRSRVHCQTSHSYPDYGGRGVTIDPCWDDFGRFLSDMGPRPSVEHSLDRIDNNGPYAPWNCRWATRLEQARNKRGLLRFISVNGDVMCGTELAEKLAMPYKQFYNRMVRRRHKGHAEPGLNKAPILKSGD